MGRELVATRMGLNHEALQSENRALVLKLLSFPSRKLTRKDLSEITSLTPATITNVTKDLIERDFIIETEKISTTKGRHAVALEVNPNGRNVIGVRLARNYIIGGLFDLKCNLLHTERVEINSFVEINEVVGSINNMIRNLMSINQSRHPIAAIGISAPGPLSISHGKITMVSNFPAWRNTPIVQLIKDNFGINTVIEHDAHAAALAEQKFGKFGDSRNLIYVAAGRGLGAGIVTESGVYNGTTGVAGQIGHTSIDYNGPLCECGNRGCLELYCSSTAVFRKVYEEYKKNGASTEGLTPEVVLKIADSGDRLVKRVILESAVFLGLGLVNLINLLGPDTVVIGDEMLIAGDHWFATVKETILSRILPEVANEIRIEKASLEGDNFLLGTGAIALENLFQNISSFIV